MELFSNGGARFVVTRGRVRERRVKREGAKARRDAKEEGQGDGEICGGRRLEGRRSSSEYGIFHAEARRSRRRRGMELFSNGGARFVVTGGRAMRNGAGDSHTEDGEQGGSGFQPAVVFRSMGSWISEVGNRKVSRGDAENAEGGGMELFSNGGARFVVTRGRTARNSAGGSHAEARSTRREKDDTVT